LPVSEALVAENDHFVLLSSTTDRQQSNKAKSCKNIDFRREKKVKRMDGTGKNKVFKSINSYDC